MLNTFICGGFHSEELDDLPWSSSPCSSPRKSRKNSRDSKNPYASRGLDKFSALLAELDEKRRKIYSQMNSRDASLVRFVYSRSNDIVPIVVKLKDQPKQGKPKIGDHTKDHTKNNLDVTDKLPIYADLKDKDVKRTTAGNDEKTHQKKGFTWSMLMNLPSWRRPSCYMPAAIILILLFLAFFGRSAAILCTSIAWYSVPTLSLKTCETTRKKEYTRRYSDSRMGSKLTGAKKANWAQQPDHRKSF